MQRGAGPPSLWSDGLPLPSGAGPSLAPLVVVSADALPTRGRLGLALELQWIAITNQQLDGPKARCWAAADAWEGQLVVQGGYSGLNSYYADIFAFHPESHVWQRLWCAGGVTLPPLYAHTMNCVGQKLVICCGGTGRNYGNSVYIMELSDASLGAGRWVEAEFAPARRAGEEGLVGRREIPTPRGAHATAVAGGMLWLFGGDNGHGTYFNDLYRIDVHDMVCAKVRTKGVKPTKRGWHSMVACGHRLYVFGGTDGSITFNDLHIFDTQTLTWSSPHVTGEPAEPLFSHSAVMIGHEMFVFGGSNGASKPQNRAYIFDTERLCWIHPRLSGEVPSPRYGQSCVVVKDKLFLFGGYSGGAFGAQLFCMSLSQVKREMLSLPPDVINSLIQDMRSLLTSEDSFWDIQFEVEGQLFRGHRSILSARSAYFAKMFHSGMRESVEAQPVIRVEGVKSGVFTVVLEFLYSACVSSLNQGNALDVLIAADMFGLEALKNLAGSVMLRDVTIHNVVEMYSLAEKYNAHKLKEALMKFIVKNRNLLMSSSNNVVFIEEDT